MTLDRVAMVARWGLQHWEMWSNVWPMSAILTRIFGEFDSPTILVDNQSRRQPATRDSGGQALDASRPATPDDAIHLIGRHQTSEKKDCQALGRLTGRSGTLQLRHFQDAIVGSTILSFQIERLH